MHTEPSLSEEMLSELRELLAENFNELIDRYVSDSQSRFDLLHTAIANSDFKTIYYEAHGIKGSSRNMGANPLAEIMGKLEALGHEKNTANLEQLLDEAKAEYSRVVTGLAGFRVE